MNRESLATRLTQVFAWESGHAMRVDDYLAAEEPLEIRARGRSLGVTLRTPGDDEELVAGLLFTEGIVSRREELVDLRVSGHSGPEKNVARVTLASGIHFPQGRLARKFSAGSACGVCGKGAIEEIRRRGIRRPETATVFDPNVLCELPDRLRAKQAVFRQTGGLHAAALFNSSGKLLILREDIGRHNAVDKVIGWAFLGKRLPLGGHILLVSGRGGFEIVQKALAAGIPLLASVSAPSSLAVQSARERGMTLIGFLRDKRFVLYSGEQRIALAAAAPVAAT